MISRSTLPMSRRHRWVAAFSEALDARDPASAAALFGDECFWRDLAAFTWNVKTLEGRDEIAAMLAAQLELGRSDGLARRGRADRCGRSSRSLGKVRDEARSRAVHPAAEGRPRLDAAHRD